MQKMLNKIICGDCIELLGKIKQPFADLIFADPPFNIGYKYDKYNDKVAGNRYIEWTEKWMTVCKKVLKPHGSFYIAIGDDYAANVKTIADNLGLSMRNWIIWHYSFGQQMKNKFARSHTHIFYFVNNKKDFIFNDENVRVIYPIVMNASWITGEGGITQEGADYAGYQEDANQGLWDNSANRYDFDEDNKLAYPSSPTAVPRNFSISLAYNNLAPYDHFRVFHYTNWSFYAPYLLPGALGYDTEQNINVDANV